MYNFANDTGLPLHLPIAVTVCLKPWFDTKVLAKGFELLRKGDIGSFFFYRNVSGAVIQGKFEIYIVYQKTNRIVQGFTLKEEFCEICGFARREHRCEHVAALCILSLTQKDESTYFPMPLLYGHSTWGKLAGFLSDWLDGEKGRLERAESDDETLYQRSASEGGFEASISASTLKKWELIDSRHKTEEPVTVAGGLYNKIREFCMSEGERVLAASGAVSKALARDSSVWNHLCALFFCHGGQTGPQLSFDKASGLFHLAFNAPDSDDYMEVHLQRHRTNEALSLLGPEDSGFTFLPPVRQGFRVRLEDGGKVRVRPMVKLDDGRTFLLSEIAANKFGNSYFFPDEGFFQLQQLAREAKLSTTGKAHPINPLFEIIKKDADLVVDESELENFLTQNKAALSHRDNLVDEEISNLKVTSVPDVLIIDDFREDREWYYLSGGYGIGSSTVSIGELLNKKGDSSSLFIGSTSLKLTSGPLAWFHQLAGERTWTDDQRRPGVRLSRSEFISLVTTFSKVENRLADNSFKSRLKSILDLDSWSDSEKISNLPGHLRDYQKNGVAWLHTLYEFGLGGILADDMGLGKTHQGLALLEILLIGKKISSPALVVCPASVLMHWADKIDRYYPRIAYHIHYGPGRDLSAADNSTLLLTTYGVARSDRELLTETPFEVILLDEIQTLKNRSTEIHKAVRSFRARVKIGLSGTPIENSLTDLYSLFDVCLPGFFGSVDRFNKTFLVPITKYRKKEQRDRLAKQVQPFILRRSRAQVLQELPPLIEDYRACELSDEQVSLYRQTIDEHCFFLEALEDGDERVDYLHILAMITRLKQICNHPCLVEGCTDPYKYKSGKWDIFVELLDECFASGRKVVVFSQYTGMLDIMKTYLTGSGVDFAELRGSMGIAKRAEMIEKFTKNKDCRIFCSSLLAGGTGIDLLAGQVVVHYDRWWNPAKEEQATARVHRMGQKDVVQLFRLITRGTLEEKIHTIITSKQQLSSSIIKEDEAGLIKQLGRDQLADLFRHTA